FGERGEGLGEALRGEGVGDAPGVVPVVEVLPAGQYRQFAVGDDSIGQCGCGGVGVDGVVGVDCEIDPDLGAFRRDPGDLADGDTAHRHLVADVEPDAVWHERAVGARVFQWI